MASRPRRCVSPPGFVRPYWPSRVLRLSDESEVHPRGRGGAGARLVAFGAGHTHAAQRSTDPIIRTSGLTKRFGDRVAVDAADTRGAARLRVRLPGAERRRQDHPHPHAARPDTGQQRDDGAARAARSGAPGRGARAGRGDRRGAQLPRSSDGPREPLGRGRRPRSGRRRTRRSVLERMGLLDRAETGCQRTRWGCASGWGSPAVCWPTRSY